MILPRCLLRVGFHLLYNQLAWTYETVAWLASFGQWDAWRRTIIPMLESGPILELAFGTGKLEADMIRAGLTPIGLDVSPFMARLAQRNLVRQRVPARLLQGQAQALPFPDASFAYVVSTFPTDFILTPQTLTSIARVLKTHGQLLIVVSGHLSGPRLARPPLEWAYQISGQRRIPRSDPIESLKEAGFKAHWQDVSHEGAAARLLVADRISP